MELKGLIRIFFSKNSNQLHKNETKKIIEYRTEQKIRWTNK